MEVATEMQVLAAIAHNVENTNEPKAALDASEESHLL